MFLLHLVYIITKLQINYGTYVELLIQEHIESLDRFSEKLDDSILGWSKCN
jgi:hypothetical protein